jgi:hypothetical protein
LLNQLARRLDRYSGVGLVLFVDDLHRPAQDTAASVDFLRGKVKSQLCLSAVKLDAARERGMAPILIDSAATVGADFASQTQQNSNAKDKLRTDPPVSRLMQIIVQSQVRKKLPLSVEWLQSPLS